MRADVDVDWIDSRDVDFTGYSGARYVSAAAYLRLFADLVLPHDAPQALYLDSDTLVRHDIAKLLELDLGKKSFAAARDVVVETRGHPYSGTTVRDERPYFNSGVLVMNLQKMRSGLGDALRARAAARVGQGFFDQDALNDLVGEGDWVELGLRWNFQAALYLLHHQPASPWINEMRRQRTTIGRDPSIVHFSGEFKPWQARSRHPFRHEWRRTLRKSTFSSGIELGRLVRSTAIEALVAAGRREHAERSDC
jgi:lipopolysaccharide biosynthesis glycosyltransferase